ncbi:hypothetical protein [Paenibacillus sp.]|uniref:hypothetical protein n=1 Tax=Paenibacillus sp. TaxID=58172 RepID=UPI002D25BF3F|nr:hypothetical protein [Paenibacillus sp.]HZG56616.1 hypothetical protein [Paenibacillus sp.]
MKENRDHPEDEMRPLEKERGLFYLFIVCVGLSILPYPFINEGVNRMFGAVRYAALAGALVTGITLGWILLRKLRKFVTGGFIALLIAAGLLVLAAFIVSEGV